MENFDLKNAIRDTDMINKKTKALLERSKHVYKLLMETDINTQAGTKYFLELMGNDTFEYESFHAMCKLFKLVAPTDKISNIWLHIDRILTQFTDEYTKNELLYNKIMSIQQKYLDDNDKNFVNGIINTFSIPQKIQMCESEILDSLCDKKFNQEKLFKLVELRYKYAISMNKKNYSDYKNGIPDLKYIQQLIERTSEHCNNDIRNMCNILQKKSVSKDDIMHYTLSLFGQYKIPTNNVINFVSQILNKYFLLNLEDLILFF